MKLTHWIGVAGGCGRRGLYLVAAAAGTRKRMTPLAERYIKLVLALGQHDPHYVDAYDGPDGLEGGGGRTEDVARHFSMPTPTCA